MDFVLLAILRPVAERRFAGSRESTQIRFQLLPGVRRVPQALEEHCLEPPYGMLS